MQAPLRKPHRARLKSPDHSETLLLRTKRKSRLCRFFTAGLTGSALRNRCSKSWKQNYVRITIVRPREVVFSDRMTISMFSNLRTLEVFDSYDGPRFYSALSPSGQILLILWVDHNEQNTNWLYLQISPERYNAVKRGALSIREAFQHPEEGCVFSVSVQEDKQIIAEPLTGGEVPQEWLPPEGDSLSLDTVALFPKIRSTIEAAKMLRSPVVDIALGTNGVEPDCSELGHILVHFQSLLDSMACNQKEQFRSVPQEIKEKTDMGFAGVFQSSFGIRLRAKHADLFEIPELTQALSTFFDLLEGSNSGSKAVELLGPLNLLTRIRFQSFLESLDRANASVRAEWADTNGKHAEAILPLPNLQNSLWWIRRQVETQNVTSTFTGKLEGIDVNKKKFNFISDANHRYEGRVSKDLLPQLEQHPIPVPIEASVRISVRVSASEATGKERWEIILLEVKAKSAT